MLIITEFNMKYFLRIYLFLITMIASCDAIEEKFYSFANNPKQWEELKKERDKADIEVVCKNKKIQLGIGEIMPNGGVSEMSFSLDKLKFFFRNQKHKNFIFVRIGKNPDEDNTELADQLTKYFTEAGYKRVVIAVDFSSGLDVLCDYVKI